MRRVVANTTGEAFAAVGAEIACVHGRCWNQNRAAHRSAVTESLIRKEEERVVLKVRQGNRAAKRRAKLVLMVAVNLGELIVRVEGIVAQVIPGYTAELAGARLGDHVNYAAKNRTVLGRIGVRDDRELLNRIDDRRHSVGAEECRVVAAIGCAIDRRKREIGSFRDRRGKATRTASHRALAYADRYHTRR